MTYLTHITMTTGHLTQVPRAALPDADIAAAAAALDSILTGGKPEISPGYYACGANSGRSLLVTVVSQDGDPILTTGVALKSRPGARLWRDMHKSLTLELVTDPSRPPPPPWIADRLEAGAAAHFDALSWTGRFAACIGWAWMEYDR